MSSAGPGPRRARLNRTVVLRAIAVAAIAIPLTWFALAVTVSLVVGVRVPARAMAWGFYSADVEAAYAGQLLTARNPIRNANRARVLAESALASEPVNVAAARTLAFTAALSGNRAKAERLFEYSEMISRRDVPTQLWLIEREVASNNIRGALLHYDRALRTSPRARESLLPILVAAAADPAIERQLGEVVSRRPPWWEDFAEQLVATSRSPASLAHLLARMRLDPRDEDERGLLLLGMSRLAAGRAYREAYALYSMARGDRDAPAELIRNGGFEAEGRLAPFDWQLVEEAGLAAVREPREGASGNFAVSLIAEGERVGDVAKQLLVLAPGRYQFSFLAGSVPADVHERPVISIHCDRAGSEALLQIRLPPVGRRPTALRQDFTVPGQGCGGQWLTIGVQSTLERSAQSPWIDQIALRRR